LSLSSSASSTAQRSEGRFFRVTRTARGVHFRCDGHLMDCLQQWPRHGSSNTHQTRDLKDKNAKLGRVSSSKPQRVGLPRSPSRALALLALLLVACTAKLTAP